MIANSDQTHRKGRKRNPKKRRGREKKKKKGKKRNGPTWKTCVTKTKIIYET